MFRRIASAALGIATVLATLLATIVVTVALLTWRPVTQQPAGAASTSAAAPATAQNQAQAGCEPLDSLIGVSLPPLVDDPCALGTFSDLTIDTHGRVFHYTPLTKAERDAETLAAQLALGDPAVTDFVAGGRSAIAASILELGNLKYGEPSTGSRYVGVGITRYSDGQTWDARVDTFGPRVLFAQPYMSRNPIFPSEEATLHPEVAPLNPVEILLAFAIAERDPQAANKLAQSGVERFRADVVRFGYGPAACATQRCGVATWGVPGASPVIVTVDLSTMEVLDVYQKSGG